MCSYYVVQWFALCALTPLINVIGRHMRWNRILAIVIGDNTIQPTPFAQKRFHVIIARLAHFRKLCDSESHVQHDRRIYNNWFEYARALHAIWKVKNLTIMTFNQRLGSHLKVRCCVFFSSSSSSLFASFSGSSSFILYLILRLLLFYIIFGFLWFNMTLRHYTCRDPLRTKINRINVVTLCDKRKTEPKIWNIFHAKDGTETWIMWFITLLSLFSSTTKTHE